MDVASSLPSKNKAVLLSSLPEELSEDDDDESLEVDSLFDEVLDVEPSTVVELLDSSISSSITGGSPKHPVSSKNEINFDREDVGAALCTSI